MNGEQVPRVDAGKPKRRGGTGHGYPAPVPLDALLAEDPDLWLAAADMRSLVGSTSVRVRSSLRVRAGRLRRTSGSRRRPGASYVATRAAYPSAGGARTAPCRLRLLGY